MTATVLRGNALALPLADESVDLAVTSPPYFGLRSYQDDGAHYPGQLGSEPTPAEFVDALLAATAEMVRVLKPSGSIWVNLGDKYAGNVGTTSGHRGNRQTELNGWSDARQADFDRITSAPNRSGVKSKSLIGIPWRYALRCIDELGLILRAEVIWSKPNGLPESVTDRVRRSHEVWFHFTREPRYFSAVDEIREAHGDTTTRVRTWQERKAIGVPVVSGGDRGKHVGTPGEPNTRMAGNPLGKLPGSVWTVPTQPLTVPASLGVDHFAAFSMEWPRRIIAGWSPGAICSGCGEGRRPVCDRTPMEWRPGPNATSYNAPGTARVSTSGTMLAAAQTTITGYACNCLDTAAPTAPAVVLDPFGGTGTTALVAHVMGRHGISVDLSADYCRLAAWRTTDPNQLAAAAQVDKPVPQVVGQGSLFEGWPA